MFTTKTGNFPVGFRRGWSEWQGHLANLLEFAKTSGFQLIDVGADYPKIGAEIHAAGLGVGSVDMVEWRGLFSADPAKRAAAVAANAELITASGALGAKNYFIVVLPEDPALSREENMGYATESFRALAPALEAAGGRVVIEGWPGPGALCCNPETYRKMLADTPACIGVNYDPSHLIRMGIDPIRFLKEVAERVYHVHGKDTILDRDAMYEIGTEQPRTFGKNVDFGGPFWRYSLPGLGETDWTEVFSILSDRGYAGGVCVELEDANFNGSEHGEKKGLLQAAHFLVGA